MKIAIIATVVALLVVTGAAWQGAAAHSPSKPSRLGDVVPAAQSHVDSVPATGASCVFDFERGEIPDCLRRTATGDLFVAPEVLKELRFDSHGLCPVLDPKEGWMYANRRGKIVVSGVPTVDNWADSFHDGLVRIVRNSKYGFANRKGRVVIPAIYDGAMNFENGRAIVCKGCKNKCAGPDCEHHFFAGGDWFRIDTTGRVLANVPPEN